MAKMFANISSVLPFLSWEMSKSEGAENQTLKIHVEGHLDVPAKKGAKPLPFVINSKRIGQMENALGIFLDLLDKTPDTDPSTLNPSKLGKNVLDSAFPGVCSVLLGHYSEKEDPSAVYGIFVKEIRKIANENGKKESLADPLLEAKKTFCKLASAADLLGLQNPSADVVEAIQDQINSLIALQEMAKTIPAEVYQAYLKEKMLENGVDAKTGYVRLKKQSDKADSTDVVKAAMEEALEEVEVTE